MKAPDAAGASAELPRTTIDRRSSVFVLGASIVAAAASYIVLVLVARSLTPSDNADFLVFWGLLFLLFGMLIGIQNETTRAVHASAEDGARTGSGAPIVGAGLLVGIVVAGVVAGTSVSWGPELLDADWRASIAWLVFGTLAFCVHVALAGVLSGQLRWKLYAGLVASEALMRLGLVVALSLGVVAAGTRQYSAATAIAAGTWLVLMPAFPALRHIVRVRTESRWSTLLRRIALSCVAAGSSTVLLVGFPVLVRATSNDVEFDASAPLLLTVMLTRAPLLMPLGAFQGVLITHFSSSVSLLRALVRVLVPIGLVGVVAIGVAAVLGPPVLELIRPGYEVSSGVFAALTLDAALVAMLTVTGVCCLAARKHVEQAVGWIIATGTAVVLLLLPGGLEQRVTISLAIGPMVGILVHLRAVRGGLR